MHYYVLHYFDVGLLTVDEHIKYAP